MGLYVHLHVCFACDTNEGVGVLAKKHLNLLEVHGDFEEAEAKWFLEDLAGRSGSNPGPKGGLSTWGIVGNYTLAEQFVETLKPFWKELLTGDVDGGPCSHERILVFSEQEQREKATAYEIFLDEDSLIVKAHECPFTWMQM